MLPENQDEAAVQAFFNKAIGLSELPEKAMMDKSAANKAGINIFTIAYLHKFFKMV